MMERERYLGEDLAGSEGTEAEEKNMADIMLKSSLL